MLDGINQEFLARSLACQWWTHQHMQASMEIALVTLHLNKWNWHCKTLGLLSLSLGIALSTTIYFCLHPLTGSIDLLVVWISCQLLSTITSVSARWTQLHKFSLVFMVCIHNDACVCECDESGSEVSLSHEQRGKNHFKKGMKVENYFYYYSFGFWGSLGLSGFLSTICLVPLIGKKNPTEISLIFQLFLRDSNDAQ